MTDVTIPARKFLRLFDYLEHLDLDVASIAASANLSLARIARLSGDEGLPAQQYSRLYKQAVAHMETLKQPIPWAAGVGGEAFELMCHCMIGARTLGEALELATRFESLLFPQTGHRVSLTRKGDTAVLQYHVEVDPESALAPQHWDRADYQDTVAKASGLLIWHALIGWLVGESLTTDTVGIAAPLNDAYLRSLSDVFNCPIEFDAQENGFSFSADQLERRTVHTADSLREFLDNALFQLIVFDREQASTSAAIKSLITLDLPTGLPSFAEISSHLHMSESSLRRRLQKENTSYQSLKDEVRCQVAIDKLVNETIKVSELSDFLGFTEPSSFVRSFKNWTGETPKSYREKMRALAVN
jgi:AraC-like DNA-binding protein